VNAVCQPPGVAEAVLIRAIEPAIGQEFMRAQRLIKKHHELTNGPAKLCEALKIDRALDGVDLCDPKSPLFIATNDKLEQFLKQKGPVVTATRIGITKAAHLPLRFYLQASKFVSRP